MNNITTKFEEFRNKKVEKQQKSGIFQPLSDDITFFKETEKGYEKSKEPMEIVQITGVLGEDETEKIEEGFTSDIDTQIHGEIKRGETIWLTALLKPKGSSSYNTPNTTGVIKCRIVDIYYGLNKLKEVISKKKK